ncbi:hypothetical protein A9Q81_16625 [Gammaproteobacteria bacterium 42_54_T18]|nr:hypothetical protein A9Q81_16625 [Gammaproteobacteria bacterium 42_54_T18]
MVVSKFKRISINENLIYYLLGELISKLSPFLLIPILSNIYGVESISKYANTYLIANVTQMIVTGWLLSYITVVYFKSRIRYRINVAVGLLISSLVTIISLLFLLIALYLGDGVNEIIFGLFLGGAFSTNSIFLTTRQVEGKSKEYVSFNILKSIFIFVSSIGVIHFLPDRSIDTIIALQIVITYLFSIISVYRLYLTKCLIMPFVSVSNIKSALLFGLPLLPGIMLTPLKSLADRYIILLNYGVVFSGIYAVGYQYTLGIALVAMSYVKSITPNLMDALVKQDRGKVKRLFFNYTSLVVVTSFTLGGAFILFGDYLTGSKEYNMNFMFIFVISIVIQTISSFFTCYYQVHMKTKLLMYITLISLTLYIFVISIFGSYSIEVLMFSMIIANLFSLYILYYRGFKYAI